MRRRASLPKTKTRIFVRNLGDRGHTVHKIADVANVAASTVYAWRGGRQGMSKKRFHILNNTLMKGVACSTEKKKAHPLRSYKRGGKALGQFQAVNAMIGEIRRHAMLEVIDHMSDALDSKLKEMRHRYEKREWAGT